MRSAMSALILAVGCLVVGASSSIAYGVPAALAIAYGDGVHAYHAGEFQESYDTLSGVIEAGTGDPRAYYFRGLAGLRLGRLDEAEADFQRGADLEAGGRSGIGTRAISSALERIQGCDRLKLEQHRGRARVAVLQIDRDAATRRYSGIQDSESEVLRRRRPERAAPPEQVPPPAGRTDAVENVTEPTDRPADESVEPAEKPTEDPADSANPFADEAAGEK